MRVMHVRWLRPGLSVVIAARVGFAPAVAQADPPRHRLVFDERYRPFQWSDAVQTGVTLGAYAYVEFGMEYPSQSRPPRSASSMASLGSPPSVITQVT
jgi:hypothetical protein